MQGVQKSIPTHPYNTTTGTSTPVVASSKMEGLDYPITNYSTGAVSTTAAGYFPRAIVSRHKIINQDYCMPINPNAASATGNAVGNVYMAATLSANSDAALNNGMFLPAPGQNFPVLPNSLTPSVNCYMGQNERFEYFRRRFLTQ